ncbi:MAG: sulfatase-like hydrolase/transferase [Phycisphaerae bacterium]
MTIITRIALTAFVFNCCVSTVARADDTDTRPNIIYIMSDDHASHAMSCYGSKVNETPNLDRIAKEGVKFTNAFCTNSICSPCRAVVFTGKYSHLNGVLDNRDVFDGSQPTVPSILKAAGYQTAMIGKWHLHSDPIGFDYWKILPRPGQIPRSILSRWASGRRSKDMRRTSSVTTPSIGFATATRRSPSAFSAITKPRIATGSRTKSTKRCSKARSFLETFDDDTRPAASPRPDRKCRSEYDLTKSDLKEAPPEGLTGEALKKWKYNRYMQDYLACIASVDDNVGKLLDFLDESGLADNTIVIYTSDQGFYLGDHGWFDKRFMYEESYRMPLIVRYPKEIKPASTVDDMVLNLDFAPTMLDFAGVKIPAEIQGRSFRPLVKGEAVGDWRKSTYYHYYEYPAWHMVKRHYGVRTDRYKLIHFYFDIDAWELYDLKNDPHELNNIYDDPANAELVKELKAELARLQKQYGDSPELAEKFLQEDLKDPKIRERVRKKIEERDERERKAAEAKESKANANP